LSNVSVLAYIADGEKISKKRPFWALYPKNCQKYPNFDQKWLFLTFFRIFFTFFSVFLTL
jgi:hypothetical protein